MKDIDFFNELKSQFNINLTEQQREAVTNIEGPTLLLSAPGAGKTTVILSRTAYLIMNGIRPDNILSITFGKMSSKDMEDRFNKLFGKVLGNVVKFSTIHSLSYSIVREYDRKNHINSIMIEDSGKGWKPPTTKLKLLKQIFKQINKGNMTDEESEEISSKVSFVKNMMLPSNEFKNYDWGIKNFKEIYNEYEKIKKANSYIDYDDMLSKCVDVLNKDREILEKYQYQYKYIQVDEAQDTSKVQHEIIKILGRKSNNIFYVADDDQSIYGFRGAYPEFLLNIKNIYENVKVFYMEENFRSSKDIVSVCNQLIKKNETRFDKNIFTNNPSLQPIKILTVKNKEDQLTDVVEKLRQREYDKTTAILYRNNISAVVLSDKLHKAGISFKLKGFKKHFFEHWMLTDVFSIINVANDNKDIESFERIYYKINGYYISKVMIAAIRNNKRDITIFEKLLSLPLEEYQKTNISKLIKDFKLLSTKKISDMFDFIEYYMQYNQITDANKVIFDTLRVLSMGLSTIEELKIKLNDLKNNMEESVFNKDKNPVILTTSHSSKGLEWDEVFVIDVIDGTFPTNSSIQNSKIFEYKEMEEERRLFYVSLTRAKTSLILYELKDSRSMFLDEVKDSIKKVNSKTKITTKEVPNSKIHVKEKFDKNDTLKLKEAISNLKNKDILVEHQKFGVGLVKNLNDGNIEILFNNKEELKVLSFDFCCKNNLLKLVS